MVKCHLCKGTATLQCNACKDFFSCKKCLQKIEISSHLSLCTVDGEKRPGPQSPGWKPKKPKIEEEKIEEVSPAQPIPGPYDDVEEQNFSQHAQNPDEDVDEPGLASNESSLEKIREQAKIQRQEPNNRAAILRLLVIDPDRYTDTDNIDIYMQPFGEYQDFRVDMLATLRFSTNDWITLWAGYDCAPIFFLLQKMISGVGVLATKKGSYEDFAYFMTGSTIAWPYGNVNFTRSIAIAYQPIDMDADDHTRKSWKIVRRILKRNSRPMENAILKFLLGMSVVRNRGAERNFLLEMGVGPTIGSAVANRLLQQSDACVSLRKYKPSMDYLTLTESQDWITSVFTDEMPAIKWG